MRTQKRYRGFRETLGGVSSSSCLLLGQDEAWENIGIQNSIACNTNKECFHRISFSLRRIRRKKTVKQMVVCDQKGID